MFAKPAARNAPAPTAAPAIASAPKLKLDFQPLAQVAAGRPLLSAGSALGLTLLAGAGLVALTANPHAGAPSVRVAIGGADPKAADVPGLRGGQGGDPLLAGVLLNQLPPGQEVALAPGARSSGAPLGAIQGAPASVGGGAPIAGQAVFVLPQGATVRGDGAVMGAGGPSVTAVAQAAPSAPTIRPSGPPLAHAPMAGLTAPGPDGPLPVAAADGRTAFSAYRRPFADNGKPKVALVIGGLGLNAAATRQAIERLPPEITLSFVPYADNLQSWVDQARAYGHEVTLDIPMEPTDYPNNDPGPQTLMADATAGENGKKLEWLLSRAQGFFGVTNYLGGRFVASAGAVNAFTGVLKARGLAFIDDGSAKRFGGAARRASADAVVDEQLSAEQIDRSLLALEAKAQARGSALGTGFAYPVTVEQVLRWNVGLAKRGYQLAPASAITHG